MIVHEERKRFLRGRSDSSYCNLKYMSRDHSFTKTSTVPANLTSDDGSKWFVELPTGLDISNTAPYVEFGDHSPKARLSVGDYLVPIHSHM